MTDKEIIIDGVDVSKCDYAILPKNQCPAKSMPYSKETSCIACKEHNTKHNFCKNNPNCNFKRLKRKEKECNEYKDKVEYIHAFLRDPYNYGSFRPMWGSFLLHWLFNENLGDFFSEKAYEMTDTIAEKEKQIINYKQALDEIEDIADDYNRVGKTSQYYRDGFDEIQDIINKAKED